MMNGKSPFEAQGKLPAFYPTPTKHLSKEGAYPAEFTRNTPKLSAQVAISLLPTPQASDNRDRGCLKHASVARRAESGKQLMLSQVASEQSGKLNPQWVEWLMGYPINHTDLEA